LERLFERNDTAFNSEKQTNQAIVSDLNIGTDKDPKIIKLSKSLSGEERKRYLELMKEFRDIFAWSYEYLKTFDAEVMQHKIPLKEGVKPFQQKLRQINNVLYSIIEKELKRMLDAKIIVPLRYSKWIANLVLVRKKNGEIRLCVDFRNLNKCSLKDNYPIPKMDHILQRVIGATRMSFLDGYLGFNHIFVAEEDREKIAFTTQWGTFMFAKMPFGLMNVDATFQCAMDVAFIVEKDKFIVVYLDDIIVFSQSEEEHLQHLK